MKKLLPLAPVACLLALALPSLSCVQKQEGSAEVIRVQAEEDNGESRVPVTRWTDEQEAFYETDYDEGGALVVGMIGDADSLNPLTSTARSASQIYEMLFLGLTSTNPDFSHGPSLARDWKFSDDQLELTFFLRDDVYWHDGEKTTADDVVFSFKRQTDKKIGWSAIQWKRDIQDCVKVDDYTVKFIYKRVYPYQLMDATVGAIVPEHILGSVPPEKWDAHSFNRNPVGNGPFKFKSWDAQAKIEIVANENFYMGRPPLDRIIYQVIPDQQTLQLQLQSGRIDFAESLPPKFYPTLVKEPSLAVHVVTSRAYTYIGWNLKNPLFQSVKVREALGHAIDRQRIIDTQLQSFGKPCSGPVSPILDDANPNLEVMEYDPDKARKLLEEAGWVDSDGDGVRDKDGQELSFKLKTNKGNLIRENIVVMVQAMLKDVGVKVVPNITEWTVLNKDLTNKDFEAVVMGWHVSLKTDLTTLWHSDSIDEKFNFISYSNPEVDALIEEASRSTDAAEARKLSWKAQRLIVDDHPYAFLYIPENLNWIHERFRNVKMKTIAWNFNLHQWWVKKEDQKYSAAKQKTEP